MTAPHLNTDNVKASPFKAVHDLSQHYGPMIAALLLLQLVTYTYLFTNILFTDHTFPNVWLYSYPSFKTHGEGRWMADLIILLQGGSGVQSFQMFLAATIQAVNGILLAHLLGLRRRLDTALVAAALCLYPAFVDYYSFAIDHLAFVLGDTLVLSAFLLLRSTPPSLRQTLVAAVLLMLSLACYPPKIALVGFVFLACSLLDLSAPSPARTGGTLRLPGVRLATMAISTGLGAFFYFISTRAMLRFDAGGRTYINSLSEMLSAGGDAYSACATELLLPAPYAPWLASWLPGALVVAGLAALILRIARRSKTRLAIAIGALILVPIALHASHIINKNSWMHAGRIYSAYGYALIFFAGCSLRATWTLGIGRIGLAILGFSLAITGTQQSNAAAFKTIYDLNLMNRVLGRAEALLNPPGQPPRALVIAGREPDFDWHRFVRNQPRGVQLRYRTLAPYRQVQTLNFLSGFTAFRNPTIDELRDAEDSMLAKPTWPAEGSVYLHRETVVVLLEDPDSSSARTWPR